MQINIQGHGTEITNPLRDYAEKKLSKIEEFFTNIQKVNVILDYRDNKDNNRRNVAEVSVWLAGLKVIRATAAGKDMYAAIDLVLEEVERQIKKHKEMRVNEVRREAKKIKQESRSLLAAVPENKKSILRMSKFADKPMDEDEASQELKALDKDFMLFRNADNDEICLVYRTAKGIKSLNPKKAKIKSMYAEIAAKKLTEAKEDFIPFINSKTKELNVLYKKPAGTFGLIEPNA